METNELIQRITANSVPVRPLPAPWIRVAFWLAISLPYVAAIVLVNPMRAGFAQAMSDQQFLIEQGAILATVLAAAVAAFCSTIPGYNRKILFLPLVPLAIWLASLGEGCVRDWVERGADGYIANYFYRHNCLCEHCQRDFRSYLKERFKPEELKAFAIENLDQVGVLFPN